MKEEEYEKLRHQFQILDSNRDGKVTCEEARTVLAQNGKMFSEQAINDMINRADANKDGFVEWNEFLALMTSKVHNRKNASVKAPLPQFKSQGSMTKEEEEALMAFKMFDNDNDGVITFEELKVAMKELNLEHREDKLMSIFQALDTNKDGNVDAVEFKCLLNSKKK